MRDTLRRPYSAWSRKEGGLTLIELLITVGIIAALAALLLPVMASFQEKGKQASCLSHMREVARVVMQYSSENNNRVLPAVSGKTARMDENTWYEMLDEAGYLPGNPRNPDNAEASLWGGKMNSIMACPARDTAPFPYWQGAKHALHFTVNQHPGFFNRVNTETGQWPTLFQVKNPGRTFLLAESSFVIGYPNGDNMVYPHPRKGRNVEDGEGMNLVFYDGHAEYFKGKLPVLWPGSYAEIPYEQISPEESFPWY